MSPRSGASPEERVVLLDEEGRAIGTASKHDVHHSRTPLHLAFSCYVFDSDQRLLVTRRALHKATFPGVWTNSFCGHPAPGEDMDKAVRRRAGQELGVKLDDLRLLLPSFRYRAVMPDGTAENEMCPVFVATTRDSVFADPAEVDDATWLPWHDFRNSVLDGSRKVSSWCVEQVRELPADPVGSPAADAYSLPPALQGPLPTSSGGPAQ
ncbi:isopentenyl-diphosphate Delta-isomerase [soil metagenome]